MRQIWDTFLLIAGSLLYGFICFFLLLPLSILNFVTGHYVLGIIFGGLLILLSRRVVKKIQEKIHSKKAASLIEPQIVIDPTVPQRSRETINELATTSQYHSSNKNHLVDDVRTRIESNAQGSRETTNELTTTSQCHSSNKNHLADDERTRIESKLELLKSKEKNLREIAEVIAKESTSERLRPIITKLEKAISIIQYHQKLCNVDFWRLNLRAWFDQLAPITTGWYEINSQEQCDKYLNTLKEARASSLETLEQWHTQPQLAELPEGQTCIENMQKALELCKNLNDDLLAKKAEIAIRGLHIEDSDVMEQMDSKSFEQLYSIMAISEVQKDEILELEAKMEEDLSKLEMEAELQNLYS